MQSSARGGAGVGAHQGQGLGGIGEGEGYQRGARGQETARPMSLGQVGAESVLGAGAGSRPGRQHPGRRTPSHAPRGVPTSHSGSVRGPGAAGETRKALSRELRLKPRGLGPGAMCGGEGGVSSCGSQAGADRAVARLGQLTLQPEPSPSHREVAAPGGLGETPARDIRPSPATPTGLPGNTPGNRHRPAWDGPGSPRQLGLAGGHGGRGGAGSHGTGLLARQNPPWGERKSGLGARLWTLQGTWLW